MQINSASPPSPPPLCKSITNPRVTAIYNEFGIAQNLHKFFANVSCQSCHQRKRRRESERERVFTVTYVQHFLLVLPNVRVCECWKICKLSWSCVLRAIQCAQTPPAGLRSEEGWGLTSKLCFCKNCYRFLCRARKRTLQQFALYNVIYWIGIDLCWIGTLFC